MGTMREYRDNIEPHRPFEEIHEFQGSISKGEKTIEEQHFIIRYPTHRPGQIHGRIMGRDTREAADTFAALMRRYGSRYSIRSKPSEGTTRRYESDNAILRSSGSRNWPRDYSPSMVGVLGYLELQDFTVWIDRKRDGAKRQIALALAGPRDFWDLHWGREWSYTGEVKLQHDSVPVEIPEEEVSAKLEPHFILSKSVLEDGHEVSVEDNYDSLVFETTADPGGLSDDTFRESSTELANDLLLLASIGARRRLDWFSFHFAKSDGIQQYVRTRSEHFEASVGPTDPLVQRADAISFLGTGLKALRQLREHGFDLSISLITALTAHTSDLLEQRFLFLFMALEKLKDMYAASQKLDNNLGVSHLCYAHLNLSS